MQNGLSTQPRNGIAMPAQPAVPSVAYVAGAMQPVFASTREVADATERFARIEGADFKRAQKFKHTVVEED